MRKTIILAAILLSTAAHAANIVSIARLDDAVVSLSDSPCPNDRYNSSKLAVYVPPNAQASYGCWWIQGKVVKFEWFKLGNGVRPNGQPIVRTAFENVDN